MTPKASTASATRRSTGSQQMSPEEIALLDRMAEIASQSRRQPDPRLTDAKEGLIPEQIQAEASKGCRTSARNKLLVNA